MKAIVFILCVMCAAGAAFAKTWNVGPGLQYAAPSQVMSLVGNGDTVIIQAGLYSGDVGTWTKSDLVIYCPNGFAHLDANGKNAGGKGIWIVDGNHTKIMNIEFSGVTVPDQNGAGIRLEGVGLELRHCYFHDNDEGVLAGDNPGHDSSDVLFEACEFDHNGFGDGYSHNMYINHLRSFTVRFCFIHRAKVGHNIKSRALNTYILYNKILDESDGTASYDIDLPNGGNAYIIGNAIQKGPMAQNSPIITFGEEGLTNPAKQLYVVNNTIVSEKQNAVFLKIQSGTDTARAVNNILVGPGTLYSGTFDTASNIAISSDYTSPGIWKFFDSVHYDYRIHNTLAHPPLSGIDPGMANGFNLAPNMEYADQMDSMVRYDSKPEIGAFQWTLLDVPLAQQEKISIQNYPNPFSKTTTFHLTGINSTDLIYLTIFDALGRQCLQSSSIPDGNEITFDRDGLTAGAYSYILTDKQNIRIGGGKFVVE